MKITSMSPYPEFQNLFSESTQAIAPSQNTTVFAKQGSVKRCFLSKRKRTPIAKQARPPQKQELKQAVVFNNSAPCLLDEVPTELWVHQILPQMPLNARAYFARTCHRAHQLVKSTPFSLREVYADIEPLLESLHNSLQKIPEENNNPLLIDSSVSFSSTRFLAQVTCASLGEWSKTQKIIDSVESPTERNAIKVAIAPIFAQILIKAGQTHHQIAEKLKHIDALLVSTITKQYERSRAWGAITLVVAKILFARKQTSSSFAKNIEFLNTRLINKIDITENFLKHYVLREVILQIAKCLFRGEPTRQSITRGLNFLKEHALPLIISPEDRRLVREEIATILVESLLTLGKRPKTILNQITMLKEKLVPFINQACPHLQSTKSLKKNLLYFKYSLPPVGFYESIAIGATKALFPYPQTERSITETLIFFEKEIFRKITIDQTKEELCCTVACELEKILLRPPQTKSEVAKNIAILNRSLIAKLKDGKLKDRVRQAIAINAASALFTPGQSLPLIKDNLTFFTNQLINKITEPRRQGSAWKPAIAAITQAVLSTEHTVEKMEPFAELILKKSPKEFNHETKMNQNEAKKIIYETHYKQRLLKSGILDKVKFLEGKPIPNEDGHLAPFLGSPEALKNLLYN